MVGPVLVKKLTKRGVYFDTLELLIWCGTACMQPDSRTINLNIFVVIYKDQEEI